MESFGENWEGFINFLQNDFSLLKYGTQNIVSYIILYVIQSVVKIKMCDKYKT